MSKFKWAILGPGNIARSFANGLKELPDAEIYAVGSRDLAKAQAFADEYGASVAYGSYEELVKDDNIDCVYVSTPHPMHMPHTMLCLEHGRNVLCEKPFAVNEKEARAMIDLAKEKNVFLMEGVWTRFLPSIRKVNEWIEQGKIGDVRMIQCDFCFRAGWNPEGRLLKNELAGGSLLDIGCYVLSMATMVFGNNPDSVIGAAHIGETNVDEQAAMILHYPKGELAILSSAVRTTTPFDLVIYGTDGNILVPSFFNSPKAILNADGSEPVVFEEMVGNGFNYEAAAVMESIRAGKKENELMTHADTLTVMGICDTLRKQWGLSYPSDK